MYLKVTTAFIGNWTSISESSPCQLVIAIALQLFVAVTCRNKQPESRTIEKGVECLQFYHCHPLSTKYTSYYDGLFHLKMLWPPAVNAQAALSHTLHVGLHALLQKYFTAMKERQPVAYRPVTEYAIIMACS